MSRRSTVNGASTSHSYLRYPDVAGGATLAYTMGAAPSATWGTGAPTRRRRFQDGAAPLPAAPDARAPTSHSASR